MTRIESVNAAVAFPPNQPPMTTFCAHPTPGSHGFCHEKVFGRGRPCHCPCHTQEPPPSMEKWNPANLVPPPAPGKGVLGAPGEGRMEGAPKAPRAQPRAELALHARVDVDLPPLFWDDHVRRGRAGVGVQEEIKRMARNTRVRLDRVGYDELMADAKHYIETGADKGWDFEDAGKLVISARATVNALWKAGRP